MSIYTQNYKHERTSHLAVTKRYSDLKNNYQISLSSMFDIHYTGVFSVSLNTHKKSISIYILSKALRQ